MANWKIFLILLRTAIFTGIVPYIVGLWLPTGAASQRFTSRAPYCFARFPWFLYPVFVRTCVQLFIVLYEAQNLRRAISGVLPARAALDSPTSLRAMTRFASFAKLMRNAF